MTEIYLMRHAKKSQNIKYIDVNDNFLIKDEKRILSKEGQKQSELICNIPFFQDIDVIYSSHYVRCISTVNYLAEKLNKPIFINKNFGERIKIRNENTKLPIDFRIHQIKNGDFKIGNGESRNEVFNRFYNSLLEILKLYNEKKILICSHKNAISMLLMHWCKYEISDKLVCKYNNKIIFNGVWDGSPEIFKLVFEDITLKDINKIIY